MQFKKGDRVKVMLPAGDSIGTSTVRQYNGKVTIIKVAKSYHKKSSTLGCAYTLMGCRSDWGIDLEFCEEWLVPIDEGVEE